MPYLLRSDGVDDVVSLPAGSTSNAGTTTYTWWIKGTLRAAPSGLAGILGTSNASNSAGFVTNALLQLRVYTAGSNRYGTGDNFFEVGVYHHYRLEHDAGGAWRAYRDDMVTPVASGTFTTSTTFTQLNQMFRSSSASAMWTAWDMEEMGITSTTFSETYQADLSGGTGSTLPTVSGNNQGTLNNFDVPACWIFYSTGSSFTGTIGKTSLSATTKQLLLSLGYSVSTGKTSITLNQDQLSVSAGTVIGVGKQTLVVSNKQEDVQLGYINVLSKNAYNLATKQLSVISGADIPFTATLNKTSYVLSGKQLQISAGLNLDVIKNSISVSTKQLSNVLGWNSGFDKQTLNISGKQESTELGFVVDINELNLPVSGKPFSIQTGTSISFIGELGSSSLNAVGKPLSVSAGTVIPFVGLLGKTSLNLSGKALDRLHGQILDIQKRSIDLVTKQLSIGEVVYPIVPVERLFTLTEKGRTYLFKQITNIYLIKGK